MNATDLIDAVPERDATGETAALFADLRATLKVPFVNLIWRHLATIPDALPWIWQSVKPLYLSTNLGVAADELRAGIAVPCDVPLPDYVFDAAGLDAMARRAIATLLDEYNRANALNLLGLLAARRLLDGDTLDLSALTPEAATARQVAQETVPLPAMHELSPALQTLVRELDRFGRVDGNDAVGSLYRHLCHWPGFMALVYASLRDAQHAGRLRAEHERTLARAHAWVAEALPLTRARQSVPLDTGSKDQAIAGLTIFTELMIARMTVMGTQMHALIGADAEEHSSL